MTTGRIKNWWRLLLWSGKRSDHLFDEGRIMSLIELKGLMTTYVMKEG